MSAVGLESLIPAAFAQLPAGAMIASEQPVPYIRPLLVPPTTPLTRAARNETVGIQSAPAHCKVASASCACLGQVRKLAYIVSIAMSDS